MTRRVNPGTRSVGVYGPAMDFIDLRSDTVTQPSAAMREAMASAEVGDDVFGEDPTVNRLQDFVADRLGHESALFVPSGTMANQICLRVHTAPGDEVILDAGGHSFNYESGATAALGGVQIKPIHTDAGVFTAEQLDAAVRPLAYYMPRTRLVMVENTHNAGGGTVWPLEQMRAVTSRARAHGLAVHLDGARLFNAEVASGVPARVYAACADTVSVCLSKGLGAPVGSVIAGNRDLLTEAHRLRKMFGGGMRQVGVLAAAGLYAVENNIERLGDDHANARRLAEGLAAVDGLAVELERVHTNMVFFDVTREDIDAATLVERMRERGVLAVNLSPRSVRLVTHLDVSAVQMEQACERIAAALSAS
jgi:threonine aldolase